jgi:hypothetical protein
VGTTSAMSTTTAPRIILGSLYTTYTAPSSCYDLLVPSGYGIKGWMGQECSDGAFNGMLDATTCWPPTTAGAVLPTYPFGGRGFYSPGLVCPSGYTTACMATAEGQADWPIEYAMTKGETAAGCCPTYVLSLMEVEMPSCLLIAVCLQWIFLF